MRVWVLESVLCLGRSAYVMECNCAGRSVQVLSQIVGREKRVRVSVA